MRKTEIKIDADRFYSANVKWDLYYKQTLLRYLFLRKHDKDNPFIDRYFLRRKERQKGPLSKEEIGDMLAIQALEKDTIAVRTAEMDVSVDLEKTDIEALPSRIRFAHMLYEFLSVRPDIRRVANIGARVDFYSAYLARRLPGCEFLSVDFQVELRAHNSLLPQRPNWKFIGGAYPLDSIRSGAAQSDMYFFVSTACLFNNQEVNAYLDSMSHAKALAFCEGWFAKVETIRHKIIPPEDVPQELPYCGGPYATYHHNLIAKLEKRGYRIDLSQIVPENESFHYLQIVASRPE